MEKNLNGEGFPGQLFSVKMTKEEAGAYSPLVLAFIGDAVFELFVRTALVKEGNATPNKLNRRKNLCVKASAQAGWMDRIDGRGSADLSPRQKCETGDDGKKCLHPGLSQGHGL